MPKTTTTKSTKGSAKGSPKKETKLQEMMINSCEIQGKVKNLTIYEGKVSRFQLASTDVIEKKDGEKYNFTNYVPCVAFEEVDFEEGDVVTCFGSIKSSSFNGKFSVSLEVGTWEVEETE